MESWRQREFFFFNDTATTEIYTLSLHDALPISRKSSTSTSAPATSSGTSRSRATSACRTTAARSPSATSASTSSGRSEEHTSELQSRQYLVCRLLLEKKTNRSLSSPLTSTHTLS